MEKEVLQAQLRGVRTGSQPYLRAKASMKAPLCRWKLNSSIGKEVNHTEAPLSLANSRLFRVVSNKSGFKSATAWEAH